MKYNIEIKEELSRILTVEAPSARKAESKIRGMYETCQIVLDYNDMVNEVIIQVLEDEITDDFPVDVSV